MFFLFSFPGYFGDWTLLETGHGCLDPGPISSSWTPNRSFTSKGPNEDAPLAAFVDLANGTVPIGILHGKQAFGGRHLLISVGVPTNGKHIYIYIYIQIV